MIKPIQASKIGKNFIAATMFTTAVLGTAAGNFAEELRLTPGNYWATPGSDNKGRVCYLPTGNCGVHDRNAKLKYRCVKPYN